MQRSELEKIVMELSHEIYDLAAQLENLNNLQVMIGRLSEDAETINFRKNEEYFLYDNNPELQVISQSIFYSMKELNGTSSKAEKIMKELFEKVVKPIE